MKTLILLLAFASAASAVEVQPDRVVLHGVEFFPRRATTANSLVVPAGEEFTLPELSTFDVIEVAGTLKVSREHDTVCRFVDLVILPGGRLDMGTVADPVLTDVEFVVLDAPLDTKRDPYQWLNGIVNLGTWTAHGRPLDRTWAEADEMEPGDTEIVLCVPDGWRAGDGLLIPDTRQVRWGRIRQVPKTEGQTVPIRWESPVSIADVGRFSLRLSKPLDFEHLSGRWVNGEAAFWPHVANTGRNVVIRSENHEGVRGHTVTTGSGLQDLRYIALLDLGRTLPIPLHNTQAEEDGTITQIGVNQVGRYPCHFHHVHNHGEHAEGHAHFGHVVGCYVDGSDVGKWGIVVHGSHDCHVADNVLYRCVGAGVVTEDGYEVRNVFERNFVTGCKGAPYDGVPPNAKFAIIQNNQGGEGSGFWFHGSANVIRDNVSCNNVAGMNFIHIGQVLNQSVPSIPGGPNDTPMEPRLAVPIECSGNICFSNARHGFETWSLPSSGAWTANDIGAFHNGQNQLFFGSAEVTGITLDRVSALAQGGITRGVPFAPEYVFNGTLRDSRVEGCSLGIGTAKFSLTLTDLLVRNVANVDLGDDPPRTRLTLSGIECEPLPGFDSTCVKAGFPVSEDCCR